MLIVIACLLCYLFVVVGLESQNRCLSSLDVLLRHHGTSMMAHLRLPELCLFTRANFIVLVIIIISISISISSSSIIISITISNLIIIIISSITQHSTTYNGPVQKALGEEGTADRDTAPDLGFRIWGFTLRF